MSFLPRSLFVVLWVVVVSIKYGNSQLGPFPRQDLDNRCFLNGGGSTLSFLVKESLPISSVVGRLDIQGDIESDIELVLGKTSKNQSLYENYSVVLYIIRSKLDLYLFRRRK